MFIGQLKNFNLERAQHASFDIPIRFLLDKQSNVV